MKSPFSIVITGPSAFARNSFSFDDTLAVPKARSVLPE